MSIKIGDKVKDFELVDGLGKAHKLSDYLGKKVVLYFYPKNNTPGCNAQACSFNDHINEYKKRNIVVLGISKDDQKSHYNFQDKFDLRFPTLSDDKLEVVKYFDVYGEKSMFGKKYMGVNRSTFVVDEKGYLILHMPKVNAKENALDVLKLIDDYEKTENK